MSKFCCYFIVGVMLTARLLSLDLNTPENNMFTDSDGLGYYMYLPGIFIYKDIKQYDWLPEMDKKYNLIKADYTFQLGKVDNGNYAVNYLGGVAVLQSPFFFAAHAYASVSGRPNDGFSFPYQLAIGFASIFYFILSLFLLRSVLLRYYDELETGLSLVLIFLASNAIEYIAIESGQCHAYILFMYSLMIYLSDKWHRTPSVRTSGFIGLISGLTVMMRPTELLIILIPLLWKTHTKTAAKEKWKQAFSNKKYLWSALICGLAGVSLQLIYWQYVTGFPFHSIGSKWRFLDPWFRVLFGWEKGWFIYTPVTILFILSLFFIKKFPFKKAVVWFTILNIWIVISWNNWKYGGSYSTRALVQSYPVFALALPALIGLILKQKIKWLFYILTIYLVAVNLFQVWQYRQNIIHYDVNNRDYYKAIYLDKDPTSLDMSLLDYGRTMPSSFDECKEIYTNQNQIVDHRKGIDVVSIESKKGWIDIKCKLNVIEKYWDGKIQVNFLDETSKVLDQHSFRTFHAGTNFSHPNDYHMQMEIPSLTRYVSIDFPTEGFKARLSNVVISNCEQE